MKAPGGAAIGTLRITRATSVAEGGALLAAGSDAYGAAIQTGENIDVTFVSSQEPTVTVAFDETTPSTVAPVGMAARAAEKKAGIGIRNVIPGGGELPKGAIVTIQGYGFRADTKVSIGELSGLEPTYLSSTELQVALPSATLMDGARISLTAQDDSTEYISYLRGNPQGSSADDLISRAIPMFPVRSTRTAALPAQVLTRLDSNYVVGLALQNPGLTSVEIEVSLESGANSRVLLPAGARISRELGELLGGQAPSGLPVFVKATQPVQVLGLLGDRRAGTVLPVSLVLQ